MLFSGLVWSSRSVHWLRMSKAKEMIDSGALGRIIATSVVASSSRLFHLQGHATLMQDASSGESASLVWIIGGMEVDRICRRKSLFNHRRTYS